MYRWGWDKFLWDDAHKRNDVQRLFSERTKTVLKGKLGNFFLLAQSFYWPQTKRSLNRQFSPKSPKVGKKSGQSVKKWPNKTPLASDLLWESTKSVIGAAVGIHQIWHRSCCGNPLFGNFSIRPTVGIHQICHRSCCGNPSIPSSELLWESIWTNRCAVSEI